MVRSVPSASFHTVRADFPHTAYRWSSWPDRLCHALLLKVRFENWLNDQLRRRLHHPVAYRRYPQWSRLPVCLRHIPPPQRLRLVLPYPQGSFAPINETAASCTIPSQRAVASTPGTSRLRSDLSADSLARLCSVFTSG